MAGNQAATSNGFTALTPWLLGIYLLGVVVMLLRVGQGVWKTQRLATLAEPITSGPLVTTLDRLASSWSLRVIPKLAQAQNILAPQDVGLLRPTILIPTSALTGLSPDELELILTHELAHVRRHTLVGTSFQAVSLNNTEFKECDLSTVRANDLASSKFETSTPPRYDAATKFPEGFDPADHGWQLIE